MCYVREYTPICRFLKIFSETLPYGKTKAAKTTGQRE
jgi:hypothetical protein